MLWTSDDYNIDHHAASTSVFAILLLTIIVGLIANLLIVYIVCSKPNMMTAHNVHVANLAIVDSIFLSVCSVVDAIGVGYIAFEDRFLSVARGVSAAILFTQAVSVPSCVLE